MVVVVLVVVVVLLLLLLLRPLFSVTGKCSAGYFCPSGQSRPDPPEFLCWAGYYCVEGRGTAEPCPSGTFSNSTGNTNVTNCKPCTPGTLKFIIACNFRFGHSARVGVRCSSVVRAFAHGAMGRQIDPSWGGPIELFLVPASALQLV